MMTKLLFWIPIMLVVYTYFVYPLLLTLISSLFRKNYKMDPEYAPGVTFIISAYNEARIIRDKIENSLEIEYPENKLKIAVISDGSDDDTDRIVSSFENVTLFKTGGRVGKAEGLNLFFRNKKVVSEIIVFSDANSIYNKQSIRELVKHFADERIGLVCGELRYVSPESDIGRGENAYWKYEKFIRKHEAKLGSLISPNGSIYAIRKNLFKPVNPKAMSDFQMAEDIAIAGYDLVYEPEAFAHENTCSPVMEEFSRKVRIIAGCLEVAVRKIWFLKPFRMFQMISHKVLRWLVPFFLVISFISNMFLLESLIYKIIFASQCLFYLSAFIGLLLYKTQINLFGIPLYFVVVNSASVAAVFRFLTGKHKATWEIPFSTRGSSLNKSDRIKDKE